MAWDKVICGHVLDYVHASVVGLLPTPASQRPTHQNARGRVSKNKKVLGLFCLLCVAVGGLANTKPSHRSTMAKKEIYEI